MASTGAFGSIWARLYGWLHRNPPSNRVVVDHVGIRPTDHALDIGCGPGAALEYAAGKITDGSVTGVDPTQRFADLASARVPGARLEVAGAEALPFPDDTFTVAWSIAAYHHWPEPAAGIAEAHRVLAPSGRFHIAERALDRTAGHGLDPTGVDELVEGFRTVGFQEIRTAELQARRKRMVVVSGIVA